MKKITLLFTLFSIFAFSQIDVNKVCAFNENEAKFYASEIATLSKKELRLYKTFKKDKTESFIYIPKNITDEQIKNKTVNLDDLDTIEVNFDIFMKNQNLDLNQNGQKTYKLNFVYGHFLNLFKFWQKYYSPNITLENYKDFKNLEYRKENFLIKFIENEDGFWFIRPIWCP